MQFATRPGENIYRRFALFICLTLVPFLSSISKAERLPIKIYSVADGLLRDNVSRIRQNSRGFLWFCTAESISRFNRYAFTNFTAKEGLPDRRVNDFWEAKDGTFYIATDGGLAKLDPQGSSRLNPDPNSQIPNPTDSLFTVILTDDPKAERM